MPASSKSALLHGPYQAPALGKGDRAPCLLRDCSVVITSRTDARISWPRCRARHSRGGSGILVDEELARRRAHGIRTRYQALVVTDSDACGAECASVALGSRVFREESIINAQNIREHMPVIASCGMRIGTVDRVEGSSIKLTKSAPAAHGEHRYIPLIWVEVVEENVRLNKSSEEAEREWQDAPIAAGAG